MRKMALFLLSFMMILTLSSLSDDLNSIGEGQQPQVSVDNKGTIRVVFGSGEQIFCATSRDHGLHFGQPVLVAKVPEMHLGMSRGPQLASSKNYSVISAIDKSGAIHWFRLNHGTDQWKKMGVINDRSGSAPEGLMSIAADSQDHFYAAWLDIRTGKQNQIYFASLSGKTVNWSKNVMVYHSPDQHVCECCKPSIAVQGPSVAIMFRNWLSGLRDLYVTRSANMGQTFSAAQKMGLDTWKLNGCPMDGGGLRITPANAVQTVWQRKGNIYYATPNKPETYLAKGRTCSISGSRTNPLITYQNSDTLNMIEFPQKTPRMVGTGGYLKAVPVNSAVSLFVWEQNNQIKCRRM
ncbi:hypothetical protein [Mucilaginibacter gilvus]|uniref:Exo-alpha-sialidase n=1 Tax=Mucilaginibacter gilvus TaxID=2305909 RepID=A0A444MJI5_9SPHI|nr:hypothetical protein [Mucilaginibacter gilvus]RWY48346.1 hypothetical protein EPL05_19580 [Mucilaginibacter gilvus]